jgi:hypothetical protein
MKKNFFFIFLLHLFLLISLESFSQEKEPKGRFILNASYPIPVGWDFINKAYVNGYMGVVAGEIGYSFNIFSKLFTGINIEMDYLYLDSANLNLEILKPTLSFNYPFKIKKFEIVPQFNIGYSQWRFYSEIILGSGTNNDSLSYYESTNGLSMSASLYICYPVSKRVSLNVSCRYEYTHLGLPANQVKMSYNQNIQILYPGLGLRFKL